MILGSIFELNHIGIHLIIAHCKLRNYSYKSRRRDGATTTSLLAFVTPITSATLHKIVASLTCEREATRDPSNHLPSIYLHIARCQRKGRPESSLHHNSQLVLKLD